MSSPVTRLLPEPTLADEFFWSSGADGKLRLQKCTACGGIQAPATPVCRYCRSTELEITELSGLARIVGFTLNTQFGIPGLQPPYVIGHVAIEEDDRARLTTRLVEADGSPLRTDENLALGQQVKVVFENVEDVWFPLFARTEATDVTPLPKDRINPENVRSFVRPPLTERRYEHDAAITGIGMVPPKRRRMVNPLAMTVEAAKQAIEDAGLTFEDIDGLSTYPGSLMGGMGEGGVTAFEGALGIKPTWYNGGGETFGPGGSVIAALQAISAGLCNHVLCFRTLWQSTHETLMREGRLHGGGNRIGGNQGYLVPFGATSAAHVLGMTAQRYMNTYGATRETLGWIALNQRKNAGLNPEAVYRDPMTMDDYLGARMITAPFGLYDCDVPCDASIVVIVSRADLAKDMKQKPVYVEAAGTQMIEPVEWDQSTLTHEPQVIGPAAHLWSRTSLKPADVDVALLYDGFSFNCLSWIEGLGFCGIGEGKDFLDQGKNIALDGILPLNPHGGQLSHGRTHGMGLMHEAIVQMRGAGGPRQVKDAHVAVVSSGGLTPSGVLLLTNEER